MTPHDHRDMYARKRAVVQIKPHKALGDKLGRGREARGMVVDHEVVIDGLRDVDGTKLVAFQLGLLIDNTHSVRGVIAADIKEVAHIMRTEDLEDFLAVLAVRLVPGRGQG